MKPRGGAAGAGPSSRVPRSILPGGQLSFDNVVSSSALVQQNFGAKAFTGHQSIESYPLHSPSAENSLSQGESESLNLLVDSPRPADRVNPLQGEVDQLTRKLLISEAENRQLRSDLATAEKDASTIAHELRGVLNRMHAGTSGIEELIEKANELASLDFLKGQLHEIQRTSISMTASLIDGEGILNNRLDKAKMKAGKMVLQDSAIPLKTFFDDILKTFSPMAKMKLGLELRPTQAAEGLWIKSDKEALTRIFTNLISNAMKFTTQGHIQISVTEEEKDGGSLLPLTIAVQDTGCGMTEEGTAKLFQEFTQVHSPLSTNARGTGLGLTIAKEELDKLKATVKIKSEVDVGTTFTLGFVFKRATEEEKQQYLAAMERRQSRSATPTLRPSIVPQNKFHVLAVDDDATSCKMYKRFLESAGHTCVIAKDGAAALDLIREGASPFDLILMDINMPIMGGLAATAELRKLEADPQYKEPRCPVIGLSGEAEQGSDEIAKTAGMDGYLTKPVRKAPLFEMMAKLIKQPKTQPPQKELSIVQESDIKPSVGSLFKPALGVPPSSGVKETSRSSFRNSSKVHPEPGSQPQPQPQIHPQPLEVSSQSKPKSKLFCCLPC